MCDVTLPARGHRRRRRRCIARACRLSRPGARGSGWRRQSRRGAPAVWSRGKDVKLAPILTALALGGAAMGGASSGAARADETPELFQRGTDALGRGEFGAAIDSFEALSDRGYVHPDASFD